MQNFSVGYPNTQTQTQTVTPAAQQNTSGATFNIGTGTPGSIPVGASGVTINILGASVNPNGANINNTYASTGAPGQAYDKSYYINNMAAQPQMQHTTPTVPVGAQTIQNTKNEKDLPKKDIVLLTDDYIKTLENYIRNDNPDIKLMGAKELMKRFREDESRKNDPALTSLLNLTLQSKYSPVKMVGLGILQGGWAQGDALTQQLLAQIQQSNSGYGLDALDAANAALKTAGKTIKVVDNNPPKPKENTTKNSQN